MAYFLNAAMVRPVCIRERRRGIRPKALQYHLQHQHRRGDYRCGFSELPRIWTAIGDS